MPDAFVLTEREERVIQLRYFAIGGRRGRAPQEIAKKWGLSMASIQSIERKAVKKLYRCYRRLDFPMSRHMLGAEMNRHAEDQWPRS